VNARRRIVPPSSDRWWEPALRYLARWDRTVAQVEQFLLTRGASPAQAKRTIGRLADLRYLDDRAYAERWIESRLARRPTGRARLKHELVAKGVSEPDAEAAIDAVLREVDEERLARQALGKKQRRGGRLTPAQALRLLRQWGFDEETIARIIRVREDHD
jgi:regulatory protein